MVHVKITKLAIGNDVNRSDTALKNSLTTIILAGLNNELELVNMMKL